MENSTTYDATCNAIHAAIEKLRRTIIDCELAIDHYHNEYAALRIAQHEPTLRPLWRELCAKEGWTVADAPITWVDEYGVLNCGGYTMNDTHYDVDEAIQAAYELMKRRLGKE
jgi:hypothetical protein